MYPCVRAIHIFLLQASPVLRNKNSRLVSLSSPTPLSQLLHAVNCDKIERKGKVALVNFSLNLFYFALEKKWGSVWAQGKGRLKDAQGLKIISTPSPRRRPPHIGQRAGGNVLHSLLRHCCIFKEEEVKEKKVCALTMGDGWRNTSRKTELQIKLQKPSQ